MKQLNGLKMVIYQNTSLISTMFKINHQNFGKMISDMKKIAIFGPYPLPYGGISIHIQRVLKHFEKKKINFDFYNESVDSKYYGEKYNFYAKNYWEQFKNIYLRLFITLFKQYKLIHLHSPQNNVRFFLSVMALLGKNVYLHIHGASLVDFIKSNSFKSKIFSKLIKNVHIIADNKEIHDFVLKFNPKSVDIIDAFLPPIWDKNVYDKFQSQFNIDRNKYDYVISFVGWFREYNNEDLYGYDLLSEAIHELSLTKNILVIVSVNGITSKKIYNQFFENIKKSKIEDNFLLIYEDLDEIWPIYIISDVFIRPTNTDGSALSIKEAFATKTPVIASDCIPRPDNTILFKNRDYKSLTEKIEFLINNGRIPLEEKITFFKNYDYKSKLFEKIYKI